MQQLSQKNALVLRLLVSAGLIGYLAATIDLRSMSAVLPFMRWEVYVAAVVVMSMYVVLQSFIMQSILRDRGIITTLSGMMRFNVISSFFGVFLPGGAGVDLVMGVQLCRDQHDTAKVISSILFARVAGLAVLILMAFVVSITLGSPVPGLTMIVGALVLVLVLLFAANAAGVLVRIQKALSSTASPGRWLNYLQKIVASFGEMSCSYRMLALVLPALVVMGLSRALMDSLVARSLGVDLEFSNYIIFATVVSLATVLPISIAGLGVREATFAGLFAFVGVPDGLAVTISLMSFSLSLWVCLVGGALYATGGWRRAS